MKPVIFIAVFSLFTSPAFGSSEFRPYIDCFKEAANRYSIDIYLLLAIAKTESNFDISAQNHNTNGSADYGLMQINSSWFDNLEEYGISETDVKNNYCTNVNVGAWILAQNFHTHGPSWNSVGAYNAGFKETETRQKLRDKYARKVYQHYQALIQN